MSSVWIIIILGTLVFLSLSMNFFLAWYIWRSVQRIKYYEIEMSEIVGSIGNFTTHLSSVYEMEMFYGDETLQYLLQHARDLTKVFDQYDLDSTRELKIEEELIDGGTEEEEKKNKEK
tara:strand:+ start:75 stop:428 length:354 start_codon:yes stop_codon:yes gene_type:complete